MAKHHIPTAKYLSVQLDSIQQGFEFLESLSAPYVLKADGLAAGKGVLIEPTLESAKNALKDMLNGKFGQASQTVVIEEFLNGIEMSCFAMTDGKDYLLLPEAKDYKRVGEKDTGLNTGGMGAVSPVPFADSEFIEKVCTRIVEPTVKGFQSDGIEYTGFIFIGLMNDNGDPKVVEYNCRMGDPETEVVIHRVQNDLLEILVEICKGNLKNIALNIDPNHAVTVFLVSGGYPETFQKGYEITGLETIEDATVYQAGTKLDGNKVLTNGGRVIAVTASGNNIHAALQKAMTESQKIQYEKKYYRTDIGQDLIRYESI
jgi:phosphoribosylamine--glycine ligase